MEVKRRERPSKNSKSTTKAPEPVVDSPIEKEPMEVKRRGRPAKNSKLTTKTPESVVDSPVEKEPDEQLEMFKSPPEVKEDVPVQEIPSIQETPPDEDEVKEVPSTTVQVAHVPDPIPLWRKKKGTGDHIMRDGTVIKGGMTIRAWEDEIAGVKDKFDLISGSDGSGKQPFPQSTLVVRSRKDGKFDVVNTSNKSILNIIPLTKEEAESLKNGI